MIKLIRLNDKEFALNAEMIESLESTPDTVITLVSGKKCIVKDSLDEVIRKVIEYKRLCNMPID